MVGGEVCIVAGGGGGGFGTFSNGIEETDDGVAGVATVFLSLSEALCLWEPGRKAGSELNIESLSLAVDFGASASHLCLDITTDLKLL